MEEKNIRNLTSRKDITLTSEEEIFYAAADSLAEINNKSFKIAKCNTKTPDVYVTKKNSIGILTKNTNVISNFSTSNSVPTGNLIFKGEKFNTQKQQFSNINVNLNINFNCNNNLNRTETKNVVNESKLSDKLEIIKLKKMETEKDPTVYETVLFEEENYLDLTCKNKNSFSEKHVSNDVSTEFVIMKSLSDIKFQIGAEVDLNYFRTHYRFIPHKNKQMSQSNMHLRHLFELQNFNIDQKIWVIKISPNGEYLAAGGPSGVLKIFEIFNSEPSNYKQSYTSHDISKYLNFMNEIAFRVYTEHTNDIIDICWSPRKTRVLLSASLDYSVILWSLDTQFPITKFNHSSNVTSVSFCPFEEQDGDQYFVSGCMDKYIRIWSSKTGKVISYSNMEEYITSVCYFPTGDRVAIGTHNGKCAIYDCKPKLRYNSSFLCRNRIGRYSKGRKITHIEFLNKTVALITTNDSRNRLVNVSDGKTIHKYKGLVNEDYMIRSYINETNEVVISASADGNVIVWPVFNKENKNKKNYYYEMFKPLLKDTSCCSVIADDIPTTNYLKRLFSVTNKLMAFSIIINATIEGNIQVLLNCDEI